LPLYDVAHLGNVLRRGYAPTSGELTWAVVDGCFVVADVLSLAAVQPEGAMAAEAIHTEVKAAVREGVKSAGQRLSVSGAGTTSQAVMRQEARRGLTESVTPAAAAAVSGRFQRWWAVRSAGGVYQVMRRLPESIPRLSIAQIAQIAGPRCSKAGIKLSTWGP